MFMVQVATPYGVYFWSTLPSGHKCFSATGERILFRELDSAREFLEGLELAEQERAAVVEV